MNLKDELLKVIAEQPGVSRKRLTAIFDLSDYRLSRTFRIIQRDLKGQVIVHSRENGVWIVKVNQDRCVGMVWHGRNNGGYKQCLRAPEFPDGRCYEHSDYENPEMTAFRRRLEYLAGPAEPNAFHISQLPLSLVEELIGVLGGITPATRNDHQNKQKLITTMKAALAFLRWKDYMRQRRLEENQIPFDFYERHRRSSINPFEYSLRKYFLILEIAETATREEVLSAWRRLARKFHPDLHGGDEERMKAINLAKERIFKIRHWD